MKGYNEGDADGWPYCHQGQLLKGGLRSRETLELHGEAHYTQASVFKTDG